ncbi:hypothetical protein GW590_02055 [Rahnella sp. SAP-1]|uniref:Uncharacterized protein n=1 Tax=Rouxiella aceris TaxID=2703884 RepID=A0A848MF44_9GAMM|nr:hypothetical protein [Rouxiella aceris]NMP25662.1 hypothetical protein [Rouxiella aceris]
MDRQYNNGLPPELLTTLNQSSFTTEELAEIDDEVRVLVAEQETSRRQHPIIAIYRPAVAGCLTRNDGTGDEIISTPQGSSTMIVREGMPQPDDFLVIPGV